VANQAQQLTLPTPRTYTRTDFAALRAFVQHIAPSVIAHRYYDPDDREVSPQAVTADAMERFLRTSSMTWCSSRCATDQRRSPPT
jgi:hypothetical protein